MVCVRLCFAEDAMITHLRTKYGNTVFRNQRRKHEVLMFARSLGPKGVRAISKTSRKKKGQKLKA
eukprot:COSAG01_NODE_695_length_14201_cov_10.521875_20_plen_65_part_00